MIFSVLTSLALGLQISIDSEYTLDPSTRIIIDGIQSHHIPKSNTLNINLSQGTRIITIESLEYYFEPIRCDVKQETKCFEHRFGNGLDTFGNQIDLPLVLKPKAKLEYVMDRKSFSIMSIFSNPMILMSLVTIGMLFLIPKMKDSIDPSELKRDTPQVEMPDVASKLADWFSNK